MELQSIPFILEAMLRELLDISKDYFLEPKELVRLWMAQGFIRGGRGERPEDVGDSYFRQLMKASLVQNVDIRHIRIFNDNNKRHMMHDLIHDLATTVAGDVAISEDDRRLVGEPDNIRHVRINSFGEECPGLSKCRRLSSMYLYNLYIPDFRSLFARLRCLRVLVLHYFGLREVPESIGRLKLLRLLDLEGNDLSALPESVSDLHNLQTLVVSEETLLPRGLRKLVNLRYLNATVTISKGGIRIEDLKQLPHLSGSLSLAGLRSVSTGEEASQANLKERDHLDRLDLHWDGEEEEEEEEEEGIREAEAVAEALHPPPNLKSLRVRGYDMVRWPSWLLSPGRLSLLECVTLCDCWEAELLPPLGELPLLKELRLENNEGVKRLGCEFYGRRAGPAFPALAELEIVRFKGLEEWVTAGEDLASFPYLRRLVISQCPELRSLPQASGDLRSLRDLSIQLCPALTIFEPSSPSPSPSSSSSQVAASSRLTLPDLTCFYTDTKLVSQQLLKHWDLNSVVDLTVVPTHSNGERWDRLASLRELTLWECEEAEWSLPPELASLTSLRELSILQCRGQFPSFRGDGLPTSLQAIKVSLCAELERLPPQLGCTSIKVLEVDLCNDLRSIPGECLPPTLEALHVTSCDKLESLPPQLATLTQLRELCVIFCGNLQSLPDSGLPPSIQKLEISCCPLLEEKCQERGGPEWRKIQQCQALKSINGVTQ